MTRTPPTVEADPTLAVVGLPDDPFAAGFDAPPAAFPSLTIADDEDEDEDDLDDEDDEDDDLDDDDLDDDLDDEEDEDDDEDLDVED